jgi:hypothetical protein
MIHKMCNLHIILNIVGTLARLYSRGCHSIPNHLSSIPSTRSMVMHSLLSSWLNTHIFQYCSTSQSTTRSKSLPMESSQSCRFCQSCFFTTVKADAGCMGSKFFQRIPQIMVHMPHQATTCIQLGKSGLFNNENKGVSLKQLKLLVAPGQSVCKNVIFAFALQAPWDIKNTFLISIA